MGPPRDQAWQEAAVIGLGANLADPLGMMREALLCLSRVEGLTPLAVSPVYLTEPQGGPQDQNWYHNAVALFDCRLDPAELLTILLNVEKELGRQRLVYCGPRVIDLDFLAQGDLVVDRPPELIVPHPRMHLRRFVMAPLADLAPDWRHPLIGRTAAELLAKIPSEGQGFLRLDQPLIPDGGLGFSATSGEPE